MWRGRSGSSRSATRSLLTRSVNAAIRLNKNVFTPQLLYDLVAADKFSLWFRQQDEQFHRNLLQLQDPLAPAELEPPRIQDEVGKLESGWHRHIPKIQESICRN